MDSDLQAFLASWEATLVGRDPEGAADLYSRDPKPTVVFSDGARAHDWLDVRVRLGRDFERTIIKRVSHHHVAVQHLDGHAVLSLDYDLHASDLWGQPRVAGRTATFVLTMTKDGWRIVHAHFALAHK